MKLTNYLAVIALAGLLACNPAEDPIDDIGSPPDTVEVVPADTVEVPADTLKPESPGKSEEAPGQEKKLEPAQAECENSVTVNGIPALPGANYVEMSSIPSRLEIAFVDCPHPEAVVRDNYVKTGYGSGEIWVSLNPRNAGAYAEPQSRYLANEGATLDSGHKFLITDTAGRLQKAVTRPGGWGYPQEVTGVATVPAAGTWNIAVRRVSGAEREPLVLKVNVFHSEIRENGRIGTRALVIRTPR